MQEHDLPPSRQPGLITRILIRIAGADCDTLMRCPARDLDGVRAVAEIMICTWSYLSSLFAIIAHRLFAQPGQLRPELVLAAMFVATFILLIDSYMIMRSGWHLSGILELKRGGLDIAGGLAARFKVAFFLAFRILLSMAIAQLTAIFFSLIALFPDVAAQIRNNNLLVNAPILAAATERVDAKINDGREAATRQTARVAAIAAQFDGLRQKEIDLPSSDPQIRQAEAEVAAALTAKTKADEEVQSAETFATNELAGIKAVPGNSGQAGDGPRHHAAMERVANATTHANDLAKALDTARGRVDTLRAQLTSTSDTARQQTQEQLRALEAALAAERDRLAALNDHLASLVQGRESAIRDALESAPNYVPRDDGFLAQVTALQQIARANPEIGFVILLIDLTSFGFELAGVLAKITSFVPTAYAALLARDSYLQAVNIVDGMLRNLGPAPDRTTSQDLPIETPEAEPEAKPEAKPRILSEAATTAGASAANDNRKNIHAPPIAADLGASDQPPPKRGPGRPRNEAGGVSAVRKRRSKARRGETGEDDGKA